AGADPGHALAAGEPERLYHARDERGLRRDQVVRDRHRRVQVGRAHAVGGHEAGARHVGDRLEHAPVVDARRSAGADEISRGAAERQFSTKYEPWPWPLEKKRLVTVFLRV